MAIAAASSKILPSRGLEFFVAPANCALIPPPEVTFTATAGAAAAATSIAVSSVAVGTWASTNPIDVNPYLQFVDPATGQEFLAKVTANIASGATTITVAPLKKAIPASAVAKYPTVLSVRESVNISTEDEDVEIVSFDNNGNKDYAKVILGGKIEAPGSYLPTDAGYLNVTEARRMFQFGEPGKIYYIIRLPKPGCANDNTYTKHGGEYRGFAVVSAAGVEASAKGIIAGNLSFACCGAMDYALAS